MVRAEMPLWVLHTNAPPGGTIQRTPAFKTAETADGDRETSHCLDRANKSMSFLESVGGGGKCPIYSVDFHPDSTRFATGGGDGTVRLWNSSALFAKRSKGGTYDADEQGAYASTSGDSSDDAEPASSGSATEDNENLDPEEREVVHDLNQLVRRKKDGSPTVKKPATSSSENNNTTPSLQAPPSSPSRSSKESSHRLLCAVSAHTGSSVLAVRFSTSGHYLASAGDDAAVCIYAQGGQDAASATTGNLDASSHHAEHWSRIRLCRGHTLDVVGLAWAPDDSHLVSCSLDSDAPIIVWKLTDLASSSNRTEHLTPAHILCHPYKILGKGIHTSTVKGVTFDPAGTYLASSGDDPAVCVWRAHDDWGLEKRIDEGIFRRWKEDELELSSQTIFRRLSWSTDGTYICSTNCTVKNKNVASTISREGWSVSGSDSAAVGAASLVGHKQPVVVSRHCPLLLAVRKDKEERDEDLDEDEEPEYASLVALGDKKGFVTVWSTRKSRPIFKLQCSESRCTVTDIAWGQVPNGSDMILLVSLLDGQMIALKFGVPSELGSFLSRPDQTRVFQLRYGIDPEDDTGFGRRRMFVGDSSAPKLIENVLQFTLEEKKDKEEDDDLGGDVAALSSDDGRPISHLASPTRVKHLQSESHVKGKKRIRPVLMSVESETGGKRPKNSVPQNGNKAKDDKRNSDHVTDALDFAEQAASTAEGLSVAKRDASRERQESVGESSKEPDHQAVAAHPHHRQVAVSSTVARPQIPHSTSRIHSVELDFVVDGTFSADDDRVRMTADSTNVVHVPHGSSGHALPCTMLSISRGGQICWKDEIIGTHCSTLAASPSMLAIGTTDGSVFLYGTSPTLGWASAAAFRSHPPLILGHAVVALHLREQNNDGDVRSLQMLVVGADGVFGVYSLLPGYRLLYKGSIMPAMTHMSLSTSSAGPFRDLHLPKLTRIQVTESENLLMMLSIETGRASRASEESSRNRSSHAVQSVGPGGAVQSFVYHREMEVWMRISDSRFLLSDFYSSLPAKSSADGALSKMDDAVRSGALRSSLKSSRRAVGASTTIYHDAEDEDGNNIVTRSHCEDRMACALALGSASEFRSWLGLYVRTLTIGGQEDRLRLLVDLLLGCSLSSLTQHASCWWLSSAPEILGQNRKELIQTVVIPEMSKNRALQRVMNEIAVEIEG